MITKRVLIVDDSKTAQYRLKEMLRHYDLEIMMADSAEAALRQLANSLPDVIFMDHSMSGMDGLQALQIIKSQPDTAAIPVIMYTSQSGEFYARQAHELGALGVVNKSTINLEDLSQILEEIDFVGEASSPLTAEQAQAPARSAPAPRVQPQREATSAASRSSEMELAMELRLKSLEGSIEANRRFLIARMTREIQAVRQEVRNLGTSLAELNQRIDTLSAEREAPARPAVMSGKLLWTAALSIVGVVLLGGLFLAFPG